jgi:hypothetical protein
MSEVAGNMTMSGLGALAHLDLSNLLTAVGSYNSSFTGMGSGEVTARQTMGKTPPCSPMMSTTTSPQLGLSNEKDLMAYLSSALSRNNTLKSMQSPPSSTSTSVQSSSQNTPRAPLMSPRVVLPSLSATASRCSSPRVPPLSPGQTFNNFAYDGIASPQFVSPSKAAFNFNKFFEEDEQALHVRDDFTQDSAAAVMEFCEESDKFSFMSDGNESGDVGDDESLFFLMNELQTVSQDDRDRTHSPPHGEVLSLSGVGVGGGGGGGGGGGLSASKFHATRGLPPRINSTSPSSNNPFAN